MSIGIDASWRAAPAIWPVFGPPLRLISGSWIQRGTRSHYRVGIPRHRLVYDDAVRFRPTRVRHEIVACLFGFSVLGYMQRTGIAIAAEPMLQELGLQPDALGWLLTVFLVGYTVFQIPAGVAGEWIGPRRALTWLGLISIAATAATALVPARVGAGAMLLIVAGARLGLGVAQAGLFPIATGSIRNWCPSGAWGLTQGLLITGAWIGSAATPPLISLLLVHFGWRVALLSVAVPSLMLVVWWQREARDAPSEHPRVLAAELEELRSDTPAADARVTLRRIGKVLANRDVWMITLSYLAMNYVFYLVTFWSFAYLRQVRHLTTLESGWLAALPFLAAALAGTLGGTLSDTLIARLGLRVGARLLPLAALPASAAFLWLTGASSEVGAAVTALCLAFGCCELVEGPYWSVTMRIAPEDSMAATAVLNTGGNLGGVIATPIIAYLSTHQQWDAIFACGAVSAVVAALLWLGVRIRPTTQSSMIPEAP